MVRLFLKKTWLSHLALTVVIVTGILGIVVLIPQARTVLALWTSPGIGTDPEVYQAVFLTNNQIYFGHLDTRSESFMVLRDVYYIQLPEGSAQGRLVKLGEGEPHRPHNEMTINPDHILFWENLQPDSPVVKTILNLKLQGQ